MKKSLIALAVLAAAGAASAQSSVTLSGSLAAGYNYSGAGVSQIARHGAADNNITLRGSEDLGGGLTAGFLINQRFKPDTGANSNSAANSLGATLTSPFAQNVKLSLASATLGEVAVGRFNGPVDIMRGPVDIFGGADYSYFAAAAGDAATRYNGTVQYTSPSFSGVKVAVAHAMKANTPDATVGMTEGTVTYTNGPIYVGLGLTQNSGTAPGLPVDGKDVTTLVGAYDFTVAKVVGTYAKVDNPGATADTKRYNLGVQVPVAGNINLKASYENFNTEAASGDYKNTTIGADYILSKRTKLIADVYKKTTDAKTGYFLGALHAF